MGETNKNSVLFQCVRMVAEISDITTSAQIKPKLSAGLRTARGKWDERNAWMTFGQLLKLKLIGWRRDRVKEQRHFDPTHLSPLWIPQTQPSKPERDLQFGRQLQSGVMYLLFKSHEDHFRYYMKMETKQSVSTKQSALKGIRLLLCAWLAEREVAFASQQLC